MARSTAVLAAALAVSLLTASGSLADEPSAPVVGARVRVTASGLSGQPSKGNEAPRQLVGTLVSLADEALTLNLKKQDDPVVVPLSSVQRLEVSRRSSKKGMGALIGFLVGTAAAAVAISASEGSSVCNSTGVSGCDLAIGAVVLGLPSALVGAIVAPGERWESVPPGRVGLSVAPAKQRGIEVAISFSF